jgi:hypothetical protein
LLSDTGPVTSRSEPDTRFVEEKTVVSAGVEKMFCVSIARGETLLVADTGMDKDVSVRTRPRRLVNLKVMVEKEGMLRKIKLR